MAEQRGVALEPATLALTCFGTDKCPKEVQEISGEAGIYAPLVCREQGGAREGMMQLYKLVFGSDADKDAFEEEEAEGGEMAELAEVDGGAGPDLEDAKVALKISQDIGKILQDISRGPVI